MDLIARYLQAVRFWLPKKQQDDILAELSEDIRLEVEERQASLGHPLTDADVEALLRRRGSPILVANHYLPQQSLIGPLLFPVWLFVVKIVSLCVAGSIGLSWLVATLSHAFGSVTGHHAAAFSGAAWGDLWSAWFTSVGIVTVIFAILERSQAKSQLFEKWNPRSLPPLRHPHMISRSGSAIELAVNLCVVAWWALNMASPLTLHFGALRVAFAPAWTWFFWGILLLTVASASLAAVNLIRPWWTAGRTAFRILLDLGGSVFFCWLLKANIVAAIDWPGAAPQHAAAVTTGVNLWLERMFPFAIAIGVVILATNLWRMFRLRKKPSAQPMQPAAV